PTLHSHLRYLFLLNPFHTQGHIPFCSQRSRREPAHCLAGESIFLSSSPELKRFPRGRIRVFSFDFIATWFRRSTALLEWLSPFQFAFSVQN
ncbi:hypothetical protein AKJ16_DCAP23427, partial [Drosera capensis]